MRIPLGPAGTVAWIMIASIVLTATPPYTIAQQTQEVRGSVTDGETGEPIAGATVIVKDTKLGAFTDSRGAFVIRRVPVDTCTVVIRSIGYSEREVADVVPGSHQRIDVVLTSKAIRGSAVVVRRSRSEATEAALLNRRRNAGTVSDGISMAQIKRSPDATSGEALNRVTGLSLVGNRFVTVRGTGERYNNAHLNGVSMTSTEPDKRAFSFDLFPANLLENMIVSKTFSPDMPGDFAGGLVQLSTVDFPDAATFRLSAGASYGSRSTFADMRTGIIAASDWLGFDNGARALPGAYPGNTVSTTNYSQTEIDSFARMMPSDFTRTTRVNGPNPNLMLSFGDRVEVLGNDLGVLAALTYRGANSHSPIIRRDTGRYDYAGVENAVTTLWGAMANVSYKLHDLHTISMRNVYTQAAENRFTQLEGADHLTGQYRDRYGFYFVERGSYTGQVAGDHVFPSVGAARLNWKAFSSMGHRSEPDFRRAMYLRVDAQDTSLPMLLAISSGAASPASAGHYFSTLEDEVYGVVGDVTIPIDMGRVKLGGLIENKQRYFAARSFGYIARDSRWQFPAASLDTVFNPSNIGPEGLSLVETTASSDHYDAHSRVAAVYVMADVPFSVSGAQFRALVGGRFESSRQLINTASRAHDEQVAVDYRADDVLPSLNLIYQPTAELNIRAAFTRTVARPELREFAGFSFYDFTTDQLVYGNPDIKRSLISNYDFRIELFPGLGELIAVSVFHKNFEDAIEAVSITGDIPERTWANAQSARNTGVEFEIRKGLGFLADALSALSVSANYTWLDSRVDVVGTDLTAGSAGRRLQGQAPYMINVGLFFDSESLGTSASLLYNRTGERMNEVTRSESPAFVEMPRDVLDFTVSQALLGRYELKLAVRDIFADDQIFTQNGSVARSNGRETTTSVTLSLRY